MRQHPAYSPRKIYMLGSASTTLLLLALLGCGSTKSYTATEQLLLSDAVDATIAKLDCSPLAGQTVYLDSTYMKTQKSALLVDSDYVISSLRQQMVAAGVFLVESRDEADLIAEARLGALGLDGHSVTYGVPASNTLSTASSVLSNAPSIPSLPEMSFARHETKLGAAKIAVFAYDRETREPVWQSGVARSASNSKDTWVLGIGPFQRGTIYKRTKFAGDDLAGVELLDPNAQDVRKSEAFLNYRRSHVYRPAQPTAEERVAEQPGDEVVKASANISDDSDADLETP